MVLALGGLPLALAFGAGCGDKESEPISTQPAPSPPPAPPPPPAPVAEEADAGADLADAADADDADADAAKPKGTWDPSGLAACCQALQQNAVNAPLDQKGAYLAAAGACQAAKSQPSLAQALSVIRGALRGAAMPPICR